MKHLLRIYSCGPSNMAAGYHMLGEVGCLTVLTLLTLTLTLTSSATTSEDTWKLLMPGITVDEGETYMCYGKPVDTSQDHFILQFQPKAHMAKAHHMLLYGCAEPGLDEPLWLCGEMGRSGHSNSNLKQRAPCSSGSQIIYAWGRDAETLKLPEDVGFKVGGDSGINYLVLQVHYAVAVPDPDESGIIMTVTEQQMKKQAGVFLLGTSGSIQPGTTDHFEAACEYDGTADIHPFAFRTHTHGLGKVVSGYSIHDDRWQLIGKKHPLLPQMFYPVKNKDLVVHSGDVLAARCTMENDRDHIVRIGATNDDEMCNFYIMFWVDGDNLPSERQCFTYGPPFWYWNQYKGANGQGLPPPPNDVSQGNPGEEAEAKKHHH